MKALINSSVLNKFRNTISENEYQKAWKKLQDYQAQSNLIKNYKETQFQSEFLSTVFDGVLGYTTRSTSIKDANLIVEKKIEGGRKFIDGAVIDKDGRSRIVIELKDTSSDNLLKSKGDNSKGGLHSLSPIHQASIYLFSEPLADLAVVSNFDKLIIFDKKEKFRQEFSLFQMTYPEFQEFYLILCCDSYWGGLTHMMIRQTSQQEKSIDDEFYIKVKSLHKVLHHTMKPDYADDLFNKFMALTLFEDNGVLPTNLINHIHNMKDDFTHKHNHWGVWCEFFKSMKAHKPGRKFMGIDPKVAGLEIWQDISYLGRTKVQKSTLDMVVEISKYDLFSVPLQELFFNMSVKIDSPYDTVLTDNPFEFYCELLKDDNHYGVDQAIAFITLKTHNDTQPMIQLFNQVSTNKVEVSTDGTAFSIAPDPCKGDYWLVRDLGDLDDPDTVQLIKEQASTIRLYESPVEPDYSYVLVNLTFFSLGDVPNIPLVIETGSETISMDRKNIKNRIILLSSKQEEWLNTRLPGSKPLSTYAKLVAESDADIRINLDSKSVVKIDTETGRWENNDDFIFFEQNYLYLKVKNPDVYYMIQSSEFREAMDLIDYDKKSFIDLPIFKNLTTPAWLKSAKKYTELKEAIRLYEYKLEKTKASGASELEILKIESTLDSLYDEESDYGK